MRISPFDFSQARIAPEDVMRGLEALDPTACLVHLGGVRWLVGKVRPNALARGNAEAMLEHWTNAVKSGKKLSRQGQMRVRFAQLALLGVRPVAQYDVIGEPDGRIVADFQRSRFEWLHTSDNELQQGLDDTETNRRESARNAIGSVDLAKDAYNHAFRLYHTTSVSLTPPDKPKSGFVRHQKPVTSESIHAPA